MIGLGLVLGLEIGLGLGLVLGYVMLALRAAVWLMCCVSKHGLFITSAGSHMGWGQSLTMYNCNVVWRK